MKPYALQTVVLGALLGAVALAFGGSALAKGPPPGGEGEGNRLSYPVILPENQAPTGFPSPLAWTFASIVNPVTECTLGAPPDPLPIPDDRLCYYDGVQVWWLSQRAENFWKAFSVAPEAATGPVVVTALDTGDLLESSPRLTISRRIRTEFTLYQDASLDDRFSSAIPTAFPVTFDPISQTFDDPACVKPGQGVEVGCFAAFSMSGAVRGTEQSINEIQGTDFGTNTMDGTIGYPTATGILLDPTLVKPAESDIGPIPVHATVYSNCARLVIQKLRRTRPRWNPDTGVWDGARRPVVNVATYADLGLGGTYGAEINASGTVIYGYNWNASSDNMGPGIYRLTFVLDGPPSCPNLNAEFNNPDRNPDGTYVVNRGELNTTFIVPKGSLLLRGGREGGLAYIDVAVQ